MMARRFCWIGLTAAALLLGTGCKKKQFPTKEQKKKTKQEAKQEKKKKKEKAVEPDPEKPSTVGLVTVETDASVEKVVTSLHKQFEKSGGISLVADVSHGENAKSVDEKLPPTRVLVFVNPQLDIPFVQRSIGAGLDYPGKILVWRATSDTTRVTISAPAYAPKRHGIQKLGLLLGRQEEAYARKIEKATGVKVPEMPKKEAIGIDEGQGIVTHESDNGVTQTFEKLQKLIEKEEGISVMGTVDYQEVAKSIDKELAPAKLVIFGNPALGTPLMKSSRTAGIDLPQKIHVYGTKKGTIRVAYNDPEYLAMRHGIQVEDETIEKISKALEKIAEKACKEITH